MLVLSWHTVLLLRLSAPAPSLVPAGRVARALAVHRLALEDAHLLRACASFRAHWVVAGCWSTIRLLLPDAAENADELSAEWCGLDLKVILVELWVMLVEGLRLIAFLRKRLLLALA